MTTYRQYLLPTLLLAAAGLAQAGRPLQTEDPGVLDKGGCEAELVTERASAQGLRATSQSAGLACGIGWASQVGLGVARLSADGVRGDEAAIVGKTRLWQAQGNAGPAVALAWGLTTSRLSGADWRAGEQSMGLVGSAPLGPGLVLVNVSHVRERNPRASLTGWNLAYEHEGASLGGVNVAPMAEIFGDDRGDRWWNLGLRSDVIPQTLSLDVSVGRQLKAEKARLVTAGMKFSF